MVRSVSRWGLTRVVRASAGRDSEREQATVSFEAGFTTAATDDWFRVLFAPRVTILPTGESEQ